MADHTQDTVQIPRGADLTDADIALLADDARAVCCWAVRHGLKRPEWQEQVQKALQARLGRRPLVIDRGAE
jgi:hypothetical protein